MYLQKFNFKKMIIKVFSIFYLIHMTLIVSDPECFVFGFKLKIKNHIDDFLHISKKYCKYIINSLILNKNILLEVSLLKKNAYMHNRIFCLLRLIFRILDCWTFPEHQQVLYLFLETLALNESGNQNSFIIFSMILYTCDRKECFMQSINNVMHYFIPGCFMNLCSFIYDGKQLRH